MCSSPVFCLITLNHKPREFCLHKLWGANGGEGIPLQSMGIWLYLPENCTVCFAVCLLQVRRHKGQTETLPSTCSRFRSWSSWPNLCLGEISAAAGSGSYTCKSFPNKFWGSPLPWTHSGGGILSSAVKRGIPYISPKTRKGHSQHGPKAFSWKLWGGRGQVPMALHRQLGMWKTES